MMSHPGKVLVLFAVLFMLATPQGVSAERMRSGSDEAFGPRIHSDPRSAPPDTRHRPHPEPDRTRAVAVSYWNQIALDASVLDHTQPVAPETRVYGEQLGPVRTSRALAIVHIAIFDAVNAIAGNFESYSKLNRVRPVTSTRAAIAQAAHDTLLFLYPSQAARFDLSLAQALEPIPNGQAKSDGIELGRHAAVAILALRADDGYPADYTMRNRCSALTSFPVMPRGSGAKTQSAGYPLPWAHTGERSNRLLSSPATSSGFRIRPPWSVRSMRPRIER